MCSEKADFFERYDVSENGIDLLMFSDENPEVCILNFSSMNPGKFERYSWFEKNRLSKRALYLFLKDEDQHYYRGSKQNPMFDKRMELIQNILLRFSIQPQNVITIGSSMGGYAAVAFAATLRLGACISINPQVDSNSALLHDFSLWHRKMNEAYWENLDELIIKQESVTSQILLIHGMYSADMSASQNLVAALEQVKCKYRREIIQCDSHGWLGMPSERLFDLLNKYINSKDILSIN